MIVFVSVIYKKFPPLICYQCYSYHWNPPHFFWYCRRFCCHGGMECTQEWSSCCALLCTINTTFFTTLPDAIQVDYSDDFYVMVVVVGQVWWIILWLSQGGVQCPTYRFDFFGMKGTANTAWYCR